ncbi:S-methyl-5-thioribose kinase [Shimazuella sp. AN120528]|uniref:S-methyl-5-thioribose kinase n=1 Tax=Shimazuella soli TaxID=1892854 RepID=UPI001F100850|nr:S-methyl-5-thioribose kinase [Shimazuella soli]MCH5583991.1 S-methyl-5-thioribose kinase [Shimazuella soli]
MTTAQERSYQALTIDTVRSVVEQLQYFEDVKQLEVSEIGDGNLNYVFHLQDPKTSKSLIVKQALPYAKVVGESWPLTLDRAKIEYLSLQKAAEVVPELVPVVYDHDQDLAYTVMEDLSSHVILRSGWIAGNKYPELGKHIGTYTAQTLFHTSDFYLHPFTKKALVKDFLNPELCKITEDLVFTDPFFDHDTNEISDEIRPFVVKLWQDEELKREAAKLKLQFLTEAEALLHGDLHSGSIFVTKDSTKVIDPEFAFVGPIGFDLGSFLANLLLNYLSQEAHLQKSEDLQAFRKYLLDISQQTWETFATQFLELCKTKGHFTFSSIEGVAESFLEKVWRDTLGFAGCEVVRRTIGLAQVADLNSIEDAPVQIDLKQKALTAGATLIKNRGKVKDIHAFLAWVEESLT